MRKSVTPNHTREAWSNSKDCQADWVTKFKHVDPSKHWGAGVTGQFVYTLSNCFYFDLVVGFFRIHMVRS